LKFDAKNQKLYGKNQLIRLMDAAAVDNLIGNDSAKALLGTVDFRKEMIVFISWETHGPPYGALDYELVWTGKNHGLNFFTRPPGSQASGDGRCQHINFFALPRNLGVSFDPKERIYDDKRGEAP